MKTDHQTEPNAHPAVRIAVVLDLETTGFKWRDRILCASATTLTLEEDETGQKVFKLRTESINVGMHDMFDQPATTPEVRAFFQRHVAGDHWIVGHNLTFDLPYIVRDGYCTLEQMTGRVFDTLVMTRCTGGHDHCALESVCSEYQIPFEDESEAAFYEKMKKLRSTLGVKDPTAVMRYCELDTERNMRLFQIIFPLAAQQYSDSWIRDEGDYILMVSDMRVQGIPIDVEGVMSELERKHKRVKEINHSLLNWGIRGATDDHGFRKFLKQTGQSKHLSATDGGDISVKEESVLQIPFVKEYIDLLNEKLLAPDEAQRIKELERFDHIVACAQFLEGREISKEISVWLQGFLDEMDDYGRVHPLWGAGNTVSFRLNCSTPNAQAVKKGMHIFAEDFAGDFSQAELRLGAAFGQENAMAKALMSGVDFHEDTAKRMGRTRREGKTGNFAGFYGGGASAVDRALHCGFAVAKQIVEAWRRANPNVIRNSKAAENVWLSRGYLILAWGKHLWASPDDKVRRPYKAFNQLVQGSVSEIIKKAMLQIWREVPEVVIVAQVHDALYFVFKQRDLSPERKFELAWKCRRIMEASCPAKILARTDPIIHMKVDFEPNLDDPAAWGVSMTDANAIRYAVTA